jgi:hypothetical protein
MPEVWQRFCAVMNDIAAEGPAEVAFSEKYGWNWYRSFEDWDRAEELAAMPYDQFLRTPEWQRTRDVARLRAGGRCQTCNSPDFLETHHRSYERRGYESPGDLIVLCSACHTAVHLVMDARAGKARPTSKRARV